MDDRQIIELYNERSEAAISETADKYGKYCHYVAYAEYPELNQNVIVYMLKAKKM